MTATAEELAELKLRTEIERLGWKLHRTPEERYVARRELAEGRKQYESSYIPDRLLHRVRTRNRIEGEHGTWLPRMTPAS